MAKKGSGAAVEEGAAGGHGLPVSDLRKRAMAAVSAGRWAIAEGLFVRLCLEEGSPGAFHDLGVVRFRLGKVRQAAQAYWNAAVRAPDSPVYALAFGRLFRGLRFETFKAEVEEMALFCLTHDGLNPASYRGVSGSIASCHPVIASLMDSREVPDGESLAALAASPFFRALLEESVPPSLAFEDLVRRVRRALLLRGVEDGDTSDVVGLAVSIALHGHLTNYIALPWGEDEPDLVEQVRGRASLELDAPMPLASERVVFQLAIAGAYGPLSAVAGLPEPDLDPAEPGSPGARLWLRLVVLPALQAALAASVPRHSGPTGAVTKAVARQYEEHPYPRWLRHDRAVPVPAAQAVLGAAWGCPENATSGRAFALGGRPRVLIAGCGTGKQALDAVRRYQQARVVAVDVSRASLGYAAAAALQAGEEAVEFLQADIMALGDREARFDIVESGGVLHHLEDPVAGWRILRNLLAPGGLMRVAVYSRVARRPLERARALLAEGGFGPGDQSIRVGRRWLPDRLRAEDREVVTAWRDFYSLDECRDLLFHAHERCFDLGDVAEMLRGLDLRFLGFEGLDGDTRNRFEQRFGEGRRLDLSDWHAFEEDHPRTFAGMYHFWVGRMEDRARP